MNFEQRANQVFEQRLNQAAESYRAQGYKVVVRPGPDDLPDFARDFKVEIVARRGTGGVLASAKKDQSDLESDREIPTSVEVTNQQPNWRFDLFVLGPERQPIPDKGDAKELSEEEIHQALGDVERMLQAGFVPQALSAAWAVLEAAMRRRLHAEGQKAGWGSSPRTLLNELYSNGMLHSSDFRDLEGLFQARSAIVHGFTTPVIENSAVQFLVATARKLLDDSRTAKKTA